MTVVKKTTLSVIKVCCKCPVGLYYLFSFYIYSNISVNRQGHLRCRLLLLRQLFLLLLCHQRGVLALGAVLGVEALLLLPGVEERALLLPLVRVQRMCCGD